MNNGTWTPRQTYYCQPAPSECYYTETDNLDGYGLITEVKTENTQTIYLNFYAYCIGSTPKCQYLGGEKPTPGLIPYWGGPVMTNYLFTLYKSESVYDCCPENPNKDDPGQCGCDAIDTIYDDGTLNCTEPSFENFGQCRN